MDLLDNNRGLSNNDVINRFYNVNRGKGKGKGMGKGMGKGKGKGKGIQAQHKKKIKKFIKKTNKKNNDIKKMKNIIKKLRKKKDSDTIIIPNLTGATSFTTSDLAGTTGVHTFNQLADSLTPNTVTDSTGDPSTTSTTPIETNRHITNLGCL